MGPKLAHVVLISLLVHLESPFLVLHASRSHNFPVPRIRRTIVKRCRQASPSRNRQPKKEASRRASKQQMVAQRKHQRDESGVSESREEMRQRQLPHQLSKAQRKKKIKRNSKRKLARTAVSYAVTLSKFFLWGCVIIGVSVTCALFDGESSTNNSNAVCARLVTTETSAPF